MVSIFTVVAYPGWVGTWISVWLAGERERNGQVFGGIVKVWDGGGERCDLGGGMVK